MSLALNNWAQIIIIISVDGNVNSEDVFCFFGFFFFFFFFFFKIHNKLIFYFHLFQMLQTVLNIIMFEDCRNQWSMSRPLLGLILLNEEVGTFWRPPCNHHYAGNNWVLYTCKIKIVKNWWNLPINNPKPDLHNINVHTKFGENPFAFTQVIVQNLKYGWTHDRQTDTQTTNSKP